METIIKTTTQRNNWVVRWGLLFLLRMGAIILLYREMNYEKKITNRAAIWPPGYL
jgi:hypothetical protein